jgi:hypothetical protein
MSQLSLLDNEHILELLGINGVVISLRTLSRWLEQDRAICPQQAISHKVRRYRPGHVASFIKHRTGIPAAFDLLGTYHLVETAYGVKWEPIKQKEEA